jgi:mannose-6-phosphate isomerase-like protein (cupin superfamily)
MDAYSKRNLLDFEDVALENGLSHRWEARTPAAGLEAQQAGLTHLRLHPGKRSPFAHYHERAEELYLVMSGSGWAKLDDDIIELSARDVVRVAHQVVRAFEAGPEGMELLAFGAAHGADGVPIEDPWVA